MLRLEENNLCNTVSDAVARQGLLPAAFIILQTSGFGLQLQLQTSDSVGSGSWKLSCCAPDSGLGDSGRGCWA